MTGENVVPISQAEPPANDVPALAMPEHFRSKRLKAAWADLLEATEKALQIPSNRFTFEFAATLMARFRSGTPMSATESKELKKLMTTLGLAKDDDGEGAGQKGKLSKYIRR